MTRAYNTATTQQNSGGAVNPFAAGKNKIINGDFNIWQRGTSSTTNGFLADRFNAGFGAATSYSQSRQTFAPGTAPVAGYEGKYFWRANITNVGSETAWYLNTYIEDVQTLAGQTATLSFWVKGDSARNVEVYFYQQFGTGGSTAVNTQIGLNFTLSTSWQRITRTINVPSIAGKTIGTGNFVQLFFAAANPTNGFTFDLWGMQLEAGSVATPFQTATGTIQGELAACQRYYYQIGPGAAYASFGIGGFHTASNSLMCIINTPTVMRGTPTVTTAGAFQTNGTGITLTGLGLNTPYANSASFNGQWNCSGATTGYGSSVRNDNSTTAYIALSAEL